MKNAEFNPALPRVRRNGDEIALRPKTYQLLLFLLQRPNQLVNKEDLIDGVWEGRAVSDDVLGRSIAELRKAFGDDPKRPEIFKTVPKLGYVLVLPSEAPASPEPEPQVSPALPDGANGRSLRLRWAIGGIALLLCGAAPLAMYRGTQGLPADPPFKEIAWWKLDDGAGQMAADASEFRQGAKITGGSKWTQGKLGGGLWFNGVDTAVTGGSGKFLPGGSMPRTISLWLKADVPHVAESGIFAYGSESPELTPEEFFLRMQVDGRIGFGSLSPGGWTVGKARLDDDTWHMVTVTYDGPRTNLATIYIDGKLDQQEQLRSTPATGARAGWRIGSLRDGTSTFRGVLDDLRVYAWALDAAKVSQLYRCTAGVRDLGEYYYVPIWTPGLVIEERAPGEPSTPFRNDGKDYTGVQLARSDGACGIWGLRGADVGQNLRISVDLQVPSDSEGRFTAAGPYFRSRAAMGGDGLGGGTSAGYCALLDSRGMVKIARLNPRAVVAFSSRKSNFDSAIFHHMDIAASGELLQVWLDQQLIEFDQAGKLVTSVAIPPAWEGPPRVGRNQGAAGVMFFAEESRGKLGGQRARNLTVVRAPD